METNNFERFNAQTAGKTKDVNGLILVWSDELERFVLPTKTAAPFQIIFDEPTGKLIQIENADFFYRDRTAKAPDGTTFNEKILIGRIPKKRPGGQDVDFEEVYVPDPEVQKALIRSKFLELQRLFIENLIAAQALFLVGSLISVVVFFYYLICELDVLTIALTTGAAPALGEVGYLVVVVLGLVLVGFFLKHTLPALFRRTSNPFEGEYEPAGTPTAKSEAAVNITVNQNSGAGGSSAQGFINNREI
jgi:hypothetical protein